MERSLLVAGALCFLCSCSDLREAGGNSSETPNTLTGVLLDTLGKPRVGDTVIVRPARWIAADLASGVHHSKNVWTTVTDSTGRWSLVGMESGAWTVESRSGLLGRLRGEVSLGAGRSFVELGTDTIYRLRGLTGRFGTGMYPRGARGRIFVYGTDIGADIDSLGHFRLEGVPVGDLRLVAQVEADTNGQYRAEDALDMPPRDSVPPRVLVPSSFAGEDYDLWPYRKSGNLRFSGVGGYILESTIGPVPILVRLSGDPVSPSDPTGSSIRFEDGGGTKLPYEIERWDPVNREADVWVLLREARKRNDAMSIVVYWGLEDVPDWSNGQAVFDTANGWLGVWHFSGSDPLKDVTANGLRLSGTGWETAPSVIGDGIRLARGKRLSVQDPRLVDWGTAFSSVWAVPDSLGAVANVMRLVASGTDSSAWDLRMGADSLGNWRAAFASAAQGSTWPQATTLSMPRGVPTHLAGVILPAGSTSRIRLLVDSSMATDERFDSVRTAPGRAALELGGSWTGVIDELRLRRGTMHPDHLRFEWGTQRREATVVWWGE